MSDCEVVSREGTGTTLPWRPKMQTFMTAGRRLTQRIGSVHVRLVAECGGRLAAPPARSLTREDAGKVSFHKFSEDVRERALWL